MKKKSVLAISSLLFSIGLLVGCSEEPGLDEDQMQNEIPEQSEMEFDPAVNEGDMDEEMNGDMNEEMNGDMNEDMNENMNQDEENDIE